jgi:hypothetical protein
MMFDVGPCNEQSEWLRAFNAVLNVVQTVLVAYIANRAIRKNREEQNKRQHRFDED